jgi:hypothetical protein
LTAKELMEQLAKLPPETVLFIYAKADRTYYDCFKLVPQLEGGGPEAYIYLAWGAGAEAGCTGTETFPEKDGDE